jgi:hypothetical protein
MDETVKASTTPFSSPWPREQAITLFLETFGLKKKKKRCVHTFQGPVHGLWQGDSVP